MGLDHLSQLVASSDVHTWVKSSLLNCLILVFRNVTMFVLMFNMFTLEKRILRVYAIRSASGRHPSGRQPPVPTCGCLADRNAEPRGILIVFCEFNDWLNDWIAIVQSFLFHLCCFLRILFLAETISECLCKHFWRMLHYFIPYVFHISQ